MPTVTFLESGSDATQDLSFFPNQFFAAGITVASATDQAHTSTRAIKFTATVGSAAFVATDDGVCADAGTAVSIWVRFGTLPTTREMGFLATYQAGFGDVPLHVAITPAGKLRLYTQNTAIGVAGPTTLSANTWYRLCFTWVITSGSNWTCKVYINGVLELTRTNADATLAITGTSELGLEIDGLSVGPDTVVWWYDDIYVDNRSDLTDPGTTDPDSLRVTAKAPSADGTATEFTTAIGSASGAHFDDVAERPASTAKGWSISTTTRKTEEFTVQAASAGDVDVSGKAINAVMGWVYGQVDSVANSPVHRIIVDGTATAKTMTTTAALFMQPSAAPTVYPAGTGMDIGLDAQYTATPHLTSLFECGVLVAFSPSTGPSTAQEMAAIAAAMGGCVIGRVDA